ncbi:hypothetical protein [Pseudoalteromonas distincta]|uniref:SMODS and SLOG-associating 2TM effector domain-containing protein n=1 Tax=Pseudoalteromonas distincta TaxID=77608 RepID=A0ABT9GA10_9GAMM|nr:MULTISPECIES: hypothetical protein [Pseudoalteromonas distincta group]MDP4482709.1 hypothetical protein [Pseudoalteromonas elyakovii]
MNLDLFWPHLIKESATAKSKNQSIDLAAIKDIEASKNKRNRMLSFFQNETDNGSDLLLEEARRLYDQEIGRRASADNKAGVYIAAVLALLSILITQLPTVLKNDIYLFTQILSITSLSLGVTNLLRALMWAQNVLKVSAFHTLNSLDLLECRKTNEPSLELAKYTLTALRKNYDLTNDKVTYIKMTHALMISASFWLLVLLVTQVATHIFPLLAEKFETIDFLKNIVLCFNFE